MSESISQSVAIFSLIARVITLGLLVYVLVRQVEQFRVSRLFRFKATLATLTALLIVTDLFPILYYLIYTLEGLPSRAWNDFIVINNAVSIGIPAVVLFMLYTNTKE
jgi:uncharacterized membrane protein